MAFSSFNGYGVDINEGSFKGGGVPITKHFAILRASPIIPMLTFLLDRNQKIRIIN